MTSEILIITKIVCKAKVSDFSFALILKDKNVFTFDVIVRIIKTVDMVKALGYLTIHINERRDTFSFVKIVAFFNIIK